MSVDRRSRPELAELLDEKGRASGPFHLGDLPLGGARLLTAAVAVLLGIAVLAGGLTWQGGRYEAWVILPSIPLLSLALFFHLRRRSIDWMALALVACTLALPVLQAMPWSGGQPPWAAIHTAWQMDQARVFGLVPSTSLSVAPDASFRAFLSLLPPAAVFLAVRLLDGPRQRLIAASIVGLAMFSAIWGLLQVAFNGLDEHSPFGVGSGQAKGFFSNRNHFAALMYVGIALSGAGLISALQRMLADPEPARHGPRVIAWAAGFLLLVVACMVSQSRAGVVIGAGVIVALFVILALDTVRLTKGSRRLFALAAIIAVLTAVQVGLWGVLARFEVDPLEDGRILIQTTTLEAAREAAPWGTGIGSFRRIYEQREPLESVIGAWVNRAHNDWLEFYLEASWVGLALLVAWIVWWIFNLTRAFHGRARNAESQAGRLVRSLAVVAILAIALHSLVDFPLRTIAMFSIIAALVAISVGPRRPLSHASPGGDSQPSDPETRPIASTALRG